MIKLKKDIWEKSTLSECCEFHRGVTYSTKDEVDNDGIGILRANNINVESSQLNFDNLRLIRKEARVKKSQKLKKNDVLICTASGSLDHIGKVAFAKEDTSCYAGGFMGIIRPLQKEIDPNLLFNILLTERFTTFIQNQRAGTNIQNLKFSNLESFEIPLPPIEEQKLIAALFQSFETSMEEAERQEMNLKAFQKTLVNGLVSTEPVFGNLLDSKNCTLTNIGAISECDKKYPEHEKEVERFVGLENLEPENFQLQGYGIVVNGTTFTKRFAKGDVLFGKRRAYLKKVSVADFDGICSGDILVIRAKANKILQGLLPYYISAEAFIQHAVSTSAGSLSPRTKWKDLESFEIAIPDLDLQEKILEVLQQFEATIKQLKQQKTTLKMLKQKLLNEILG